MFNFTIRDHRTPDNISIQKGPRNVHLFSPSHRENPFFRIAVIWCRVLKFPKEKIAETSENYIRNWTIIPFHLIGSSNEGKYDSKRIILIRLSTARQEVHTFTQPLLGHLLVLNWIRARHFTVPMSYRPLCWKCLFSKLRRVRSGMSSYELLYSLPLCDR